MKELGWGQTPWDNLSREELLREVQRMWSCIVSVDTCLKLNKLNNAYENGGICSSYWTCGTGYEALNKTSYIINKIKKDYDLEDVYRAFFRYADDLLFEKVGVNWYCCPKCRMMIGNRNMLENMICKEHTLSINCDGILRKFCWDDLRGG
jgi:hypothetical protein